MTVNVSPFGPKPQFIGADGLPLVGGLLFWYVAGSVGTKQNSYTSSTGLSANTNPIVLNSLGEPSTEVWLTAGLAYKAVLAPATDTDPPSSPIWSIDNLYGINDTTSAIDQWVASGLTPTYVSATSFTLVGDQTSQFQVGRRVKSLTTGGTIYSTISASAFGALTTVTVVNDSGVLDSGLSAVSYGLLSSLNDAMPRGIDGGWNLLLTQTASASATINFTAAGPGFDNTYDSYMIVLSNVKAATDAVNFGLRVGTGGGPTYQTASYLFSGSRSGPANTVNHGSTTDSITDRISLSAVAGTAGLGNASGKNCCGVITYDNPESTDFTNIRFAIDYNNAADNSVQSIRGGGTGGAQAITGIRFLMSSGNIASGTFRLYGLRK